MSTGEDNTNSSLSLHDVVGMLVQIREVQIVLAKTGKSIRYDGESCAMYSVDAINDVLSKMTAWAGKLEKAIPPVQAPIEGDPDV